MTDVLGNVSRETMQKLQDYCELTAKWTPKINLISSSTVDVIWERHIQDSAQLLRFVDDGAETWADLGSGGGFPGCVISLLRPNIKMTLLESDQRKATFLRTCKRVLDLNCIIVSNRIEATTPLDASIVSARALAPLPKLLGYVTRHLQPNGTALLPKGQNFEQELAEARKTWSFDVTRHASLTDPTAHILQIERITRV